MIIKGANLGEVSVELKGISNYEWTDSKELEEIIKKLENLYLNIRTQAKWDMMKMEM